MLSGAAALDAYAASLPAFYLGYAQMVNPALAISNPDPAPAPVAVTMSRQSAQKADNKGMEEKLEKVIDRLGVLETIAESTGKTAFYIDQVTDGGVEMRMRSDQ